jgi:hypothetical protein
VATCSTLGLRRCGLPPPPPLPSSLNVRTFLGTSHLDRACVVHAAVYCSSLNNHPLLARCVQRSEILSSYLVVFSQIWKQRWANCVGRGMSVLCFCRVLKFIQLKTGANICVSDKCLGQVGQMVRNVQKSSVCINKWHRRYLAVLEMLLEVC